jgi:uncharacterized protein YjbJ (UPF0337 family)
VVSSAQEPVSPRCVGRQEHADRLRERDMNWDQIKGNWKEFTGKAKEKWGKLTDDDLNVVEGRREQLEGKLQQRYGFAKDQVRKDVDDWFNTLK